MPLPNGRDYVEDVTAVINLYTSANSNINMELIDPDRNPGFVARYDRERSGITRGSLILEGELGFRVISPEEMYDVTRTQGGGINITGVAIERRITSALLFLGAGVTPVVYEIIGHDSFPLSAVNMQEEMEGENIVLDSINLLVSSIPSNASALILNHPQRDLSPSEAEKLLEYLEGGGRLMVMVDYNIRELDNLNEVLASYGFRFDYGILHETNPRYAVFDERSTWPDVIDHAITRPLIDKVRNPILMFEAMAVSALDAVRQTVEITPLLVSSADAFHRTDLNNTSPGRTASDIPGPLVLAAAVRDPVWIQDNEPQARIVVIGSGSFLPLASAGFVANRDFFMNSLAWLQDRPEAISVRSKSLFLLPLNLNALQIVIFGGIFIFIIPMAFFVTGFITWLKRRHL
jgi:hypothetical protein